MHRSALALAQQVAGLSVSAQVNYYVRPDSYTDPTSGLTFLYIKQTINGLQVEDGDMNAVFASDGE